MKATTLYAFDAQKKGQLGFRPSEQLLLIREDTGIAGWGFARNSLQQEGFVPLSYLSFTAPPHVPEAFVSPRVKTIDKESAALLEWVDSRIRDYHVEDFGSCWRDGRALMALCNALRPGTFDLPFEFGSPEENASKAVEAAERLLEIPCIVSPNEICDASLAPERMELYVRSFMLKQRQLLDKADAEERKQRQKGGMYKVVSGKCFFWFFFVFCFIISPTNNQRKLEQSRTKLRSGATLCRKAAVIMRAFRWTES